MSDESLMASLVHPIADVGLGNTSYLVVAGDRAAVIDPRRDVTEYLALAQQLGTTIVAAFETHLHADFVSGARELAAATGARIYAASTAHLVFDHVPIEPDMPVAIGEVTLRVLPTPGHTPEHVAYVASIGTTQAVFSGGSLIVGGAARTDLTGSARTTELARAQYASVATIAALPPSTALFPTHGAGSFCSTGPTATATSTIGRELANNPLLSAGSEERFVEMLIAGFGSYPRYFSHLREVNRRGATLLRDLPPIPRFDVARATDATGRGAWLIDGRVVDRWAAEHPAGAISIAVRPEFASWLGWVVPFGGAVVLLIDPAQLVEASLLAHRIGYDRILGWTTIEDWRDAGTSMRTTETPTPEQTLDRMRNGTLLLDVRQRAELDELRVPGAHHLELGDIIAGALPDADDIIAFCGHGERSTTAVSLLERRGIRAASLQGGTSAWRRSGAPVEA